MAPDPEQIPSRTCGCADCLIDYPPHRYGERPPQDVCQGRWRVRWRSEGGKQRQKLFATLPDAYVFLVQVRRAHAA